MKREDTEKMIVYGIVAPFLVCMVIFVIVVMRSAIAYAEEPEPTQPEIWTGPDIPQCDQPLWERIKDRCADDGE